MLTWAYDDGRIVVRGKSHRIHTRNGISGSGKQLSDRAASVICVGIRASFGAFLPTARLHRTALRRPGLRWKKVEMRAHRHITATRSTMDVHSSPKENGNRAQ